MPENSADDPFGEFLNTQPKVAKPAPDPYHEFLSSQPVAKDTSERVGPKEMGAPLLSARSLLAGPRNILGEAKAGTAGVVQAVAGLLDNVVTDHIAPELGNKITDFSNAFVKAMDPKNEHPVFRAMGTMAPSALAMAMMPEVEGASLLGTAGRYLVGDALGAAVSPQSGKTTEERNQGRTMDAALGVLGVVPVVGAHAVGNALIHQANSKALTKLLEKVTEITDASEPEGTKVAANISPVVAQKKYLSKIQGVRAQAEAVGGVDTMPILEQIDALKTPKGNPSTPLIKRLKSEVEDYRPTEPPVVRGVSKGMSEKTKESLRKLGISTEPTPGAVGDIYHLQGLSDDIEKHIKTLPTDKQQGKEIEALRDLKGTIDTKIRELFKKNPSLAARHAQVEGSYKTVLDGIKDPTVMAMADPNPLIRKKAILGLIQSGDEMKAKKVAETLGAVGSENRKAAYNIVLYDAAIKAIDKKSGKINAAAFAQYFKEHEVASTLKHFESPEGRQLREGINNLIEWQNVGGGPEGHHFIAHAATRASFFGVLLGAERAARALGHGDLAGAGESFITAAGAAYATHKIGQFLDTALSTRFGRNFLISASRVKPESPEMAKLVSQFTQRLARVAPVGQAGIGALRQPQSSEDTHSQ